MGSLPPWPVIEELLLKLILPAFGASAALFVLTCFSTRSSALRMIGGAAALVAGLAAGNYFRDLLTWWPLDPAAIAAANDDPSAVPWWQVERTYPALLPATVLALCGGVAAAVLSPRTHRGMGLAIWLFTASGCALWLTEVFPPWSFPATLAVVFAAMVLNWKAVLQIGRIRTGRIALPVIAAGWGGTAATVLIFAHSAKFSDLAALLTAALLGTCLIAMIWNQNSAVYFAAPAVFFPALMLGGAVNTFSEVPPIAFALVAFAPCALWLVHLPRIRRWPLRFQALAAVVAVMIPCAAALILTMRAETLDFGME
jgi:hypothetical protein